MLYFSDPGFRVFLEHIGLSPAKSKTIGPLKIPDQVFSDFIRGMWDGDGCWHIHRKPRRSASHPGYLRGTLTSASPAFLEWIQTTVERIVGLCGHIYGIRLVYYGREAVALGEWLYWAPDIPALSRKRSIWERFSDRSHAPSG
jgi:hypothetical protein